VDLQRLFFEACRECLNLLLLLPMAVSCFAAVAFTSMIVASCSLKANPMKTRLLVIKKFRPVENVYSSTVN
jgi:hypothetical protein